MDIGWIENKKNITDFWFPIDKPKLEIRDYEYFPLFVSLHFNKNGLIFYIYPLKLVNNWTREL